MIYWQLINDFRSATKVLTYLTYKEYEEILHTKKLITAEKYNVNIRIVEFLKRACTHQCNLRKLGLVYRKEYGNPPKIEFKKYGFYTEFKHKEQIICGSPRKGLANTWRCLNGAGEGTLHLGYGYCKLHEKDLNTMEREVFWATIKNIYKDVPSIQELIERSAKAEKVALKDMEADLGYLEIARQGLMKRVSDSGGNMSREQSMDLAGISEISAKIKALKAKTEQLNWIPPDQVVAVVLQVLNAVVDGESPEVQQRIASRAMSLKDIIIPRVEKNLLDPIYKRTEEIKGVIEKVGNYVEEGKHWTETKEVVGYEVEVPEAIKRPIPNYKKNHSWLKKKPPVIQ